MRRINLSQSDKDFIKANYLTMKQTDIAAELGCHNATVSRHIKQLGGSIPADECHARKRDSYKSDAPIYYPIDTELLMRAATELANM